MRDAVRPGQPFSTLDECINVCLSDLPRDVLRVSARYSTDDVRRVRVRSELALVLLNILSEFAGSVVLASLDDHGGPRQVQDGDRIVELDAKRTQGRAEICITISGLLQPEVRGRYRDQNHPSWRLYAAQQVVEYCSGHFDASTEESGRARFFFDFPVEEQPPDEEASVG